MSDNGPPQMPAPVCLIKNSDKGLQTVESSLDLLRGIQQPVVVVAVVGLYRTGKSYLMNRLAGQQSGFALGSTIESKTKGIWMWCVPHPTKEGHTLVLLDTEGLGDVDKGDSKNDAWIFCLAVLLSSTLVYNSRGTIDNQAIEKLHYVTELTENIRVKSAAASNDDDDDDNNPEDCQFVRFFPDFVWAVRDFTLERKIDGHDVSEDEYLDFALQLKKGRSQKIMMYNLPRDCIRNFFPTRKCFTFPFPMSTSNMTNLDSITEEDLDPDFLRVADRFCAYIFEGSRGKTMQGGYEVTGSRFSHLVKNYVDTISSGKVPCLENAVVALAEIENQLAVNEGFQLYEQGMEDLKKDFPIDLGPLSEEHQRLVGMAEQQFSKRSFSDEEATYLTQLLERVAKLYAQLITQNEEASVKFCQKLLSDLYAPLTANIQGTYTKAGGYKIYCTDRDDMIAKYRKQEKKGMKAEEVLEEFLQEKNSEATTILMADERLTEADKKTAEAQEQAALQAQKAQVEMQRQEELQRTLKEEKRSQEKWIKHMEEKIEEEKRLQREELDRALESKLKEQREMLEKGFEDRAETMGQEIEQLKKEKQQQQDDAGNRKMYFFPCTDFIFGTEPSKPFAQPKGEKMVKNVKRGEDIILSWEANTGVYGKWKKGNQLLENGGKISMKQSHDYKVFTLIIKNAKEEDEGEYTLEVSNRRNTVEGSIEVRLLEYDMDWRRIEWEENETVKRVLEEFMPSNAEFSHFRVLLHGPVGGGKSSIINSILSTFQGRIIVKASAGVTSSGISNTKTYKTYSIQDQKGKALPFVFSDIMGLQNGETGGVLSADIISALKGHVREDYEFNPASPLSEGDCGYIINPTLNDKAHCLVSVVRADMMAELNDTASIITKMRGIKEAASDLGIPQVVFMTHVDICPIVREDLTHIYSSKMIEQLMQRCSNKLGVPLNCIFPVKNYHKENRVNTEIDSLILDFLQTIVHYTNDYVKDK